jgi:hypothetical protein
VDLLVPISEVVLVVELVAEESVVEELVVVLAEDISLLALVPTTD